MTAGRPTIAVIDLDALAYNFTSVKRFVGDDLKYMAVVKASAYGHGAIACATRLAAENIDWFGVALPEEGVEIRKAGIVKPILCLGSFWPGQESLIAEHSLTPVIYDLERAELLDKFAANFEMTADVHVKIDTGMGRLGVRSDALEEFVKRLTKFKNLRVDGLMTHFAVADDLKQNEFTALQIERFDQAVEIFRRNGFNPTYIDLANSPGAIAHPESRSNMVRLGGVLYGLGGDILPKGIDVPDLQPVMKLWSQISSLKTLPKGESVGYGRTFTTTRDSLIAGVPIGYDDGYARNLSNKGRMIVNGQFAPVVGRVSMDWTTLDVTDIANVKIGNRVTIIGSDGRASIKAEEIAASLSTISYEITCGIATRVPRIIEEKS